MRFTIASGKGGTGKTTLATNLAYALAANGVSKDIRSLWERLRCALETTEPRDTHDARNTLRFSFPVL